ncbi:MAG: SLC13 family permease [Planctomycetota bacterium]|nr:MAG: SLC13 family permease [Planctomycetota bacterium]
MTPAQFTLGVVALVFGLLIFTRLTPDVILIGGVMLLLVFGILDAGEALGGLSNEGPITIGVLFVVGAAVRETGAVDFITGRLFGRPRSAERAIVRMMIPTMAFSAVMNNTPLVAMMIPAVGDWARTNRIAVSKLLIPLSYAAILGGTCSLIGTSTNLVVQGMLLNEIDKGTVTGPGLAMFDISWIGVPAAIIGGAFIIATSRWLLPDRRPALSMIDDVREYTVEMQVAPDSPLVGKSIEAAGLRHLPGVFLAEIDRDGHAIPAVSPQEVLRGGDRLLFVGIVESVVDLQRIRGLVPATDQVAKLASPRPQRCLIEAVVSNSCPLVGKTIRDGRFRNVYNAVVVAVARNGERLHKKIGDVVLHPGDTLLVEAHPSFADQQRNSRDFLLVSRLEGSNPRRHDRAWIAMTILVAMITAVTLQWLPFLQAALIAAALMMLTRSVSIEAARRSIDWEVLLAIAASFAIGTALEKTGAASDVSQQMIHLAGGQAWFALAILYLITLVATELITNNAAAALMFPFALVTARSLGVNHMPFVIAVMMASSAGFATPIGYQTNLMVYGPGGYRFMDYVRIGVPLDILVGIVTVLLAPLVWPF